MGFDHERLRVYARALELMAAVELLVKGLPATQASLADQLRRAASSVVLNIAEGASEFSRKEKMRFYRMARRSAAETAAALDVLVAGRVRTRMRVEDAASACDDVARMLTGLARLPVPGPAARQPGHAPAAPAPGPANVPAPSPRSAGAAPAATEP